MAVVEVAEGESALAELATARFDLLILELDLPVYDGVMVMNMHRVMLANQPVRIEPPAVIFMLAAEVRGNSILPDHLHALGVDGVIDDDPGNDVAGLVHALLKARECRAAAGKPAAA